MGRPTELNGTGTKRVGKEGRTEGTTIYDFFVFRSQFGSDVEERWEKKNGNERNMVHSNLRSNVIVPHRHIPFSSLADVSHFDRG